MEMKPKTKKGVLLTLTMIVLFVLMLGELITYIVLGISYDQLGANGSAALSSAGLVSLLNSGSSAFLSSSLNNALNALAIYEGTPSLRYSTFVNNTQYGLESLMTNGTIYGTNMSSYMGGATLAQYVSAVLNSPGAQQGVLTLSNLSISVYQTNPFVVTAKLTGLATLNSSYGYVTYGISAVANVSINGTQDIYGAESDNPSTIKSISKYPYPILIANSLAIAGSRSPFMFAYGTLVYLGGTPTSCSNMPTLPANSFILVTPNAANLGLTACGAIGLVTNALPASGVTVSYLIYTANQLSANVIPNGTIALLNGASLSLLDLTPLQTAIQNGYYFASNYSPNYLQNVQQSTTKEGPGGLFSFNLLNRQDASFNGISEINTNTVIISNTLQQFTISAWVNLATLSGITQIAGEGGCNIAGVTGLGAGEDGPGVIYFGCVGHGRLSATIPLAANTWYQVVGVYNSGKAYIYINGNNEGTGSFTLGGNSVFTIGGDSGDYYSGSIANVQVYSTSLSPAQVSSLYTSGLYGPPIFNSTLVAWYPLNGNANDYSGYNINGTPTNVVYYNLQGYTMDPIFHNLLNGYNSSAVKGVLNCANLQQCGNSSYSHLYLGSRALAVSNRIVLNETGALGLYNGIVPQGISFNGNGIINTVSSLSGSNYPFAIAMWIDPTAFNFGSNDVESLFSWTGYQSFGLAAQGSNGNLFIHRCTSADTMASPAVTPSNLNSWMFVALSVTPATGNYLFQLNGQQQTVINTNSFSTANGIGIGLGQAYCGDGNFIGEMADVQLYNAPLSTGQMEQLYQNNTVNGITPVDYWPLASSYNGLFNQTPDIVSGSTGLFYSSSVICTSASVVYNTCKLHFIVT